MKTKPVLTIDRFNDVKNFKAWLKQQPSHRKFDYLDVHDCGFASYANEFFTMPSGVHKVSAGGFAITLRDDDSNPVRRIRFTRAMDKVNVTMSGLGYFTAGQLLKKLSR